MSSINSVVLALTVDVSDETPDAIDSVKESLLRSLPEHFQGQAEVTVTYR